MIESLVCRILPTLLTLALLTPGAVSAQTDYPSRPIKIMVPLAPGGTADLVPRILAERLTARWGQPVVVENRPGGALHLATEAVARAEPDGYTLLAAPQGPLVLSPSLYSKLGYDPAAFAPVTVTVRLPYVFVANAKVPVSNLADLTAYAKANPDKLNFGTPAIGSAQHLAVEWFKTLAGVRLTHVPYRGAAPAMTDLLAGHVQLMFDNSANVLHHIKEGRLKPLAVGAPPRLAELPDVPAMTEIYPSFFAASWFAIVATPKTPAPITAKLSAAMAEILRMPDVTSRLRDLGATPVGSPPEETGVFLRQETERWRKVIQDAGIKLD